VPSIGVFEIPNSTRGFRSAARRATSSDVWACRPTKAVDDIVAGQRTDVVVIPDGFTNYGLQALGAKGKKALRDWVNGGGRLVAWQGGALLATKAGISTTQYSTSNTNAPGTLIRVSLDPASPLATGIGGRDWVMYQDDPVMKPGLGAAIGTFPAAGSTNYATSGLALGVSGLAGTSAVAAEAVGSGGSCRSRATRTSGPGRRARSGCCGTRSSGQPGRDARPRGGLEGAGRGREGGPGRGRRRRRLRVGDPDPRPRGRCDRDGEDPRPRGAEVARFDLGSDVLFLVANRKDLSRRRARSSTSSSATSTRPGSTARREHAIGQEWRSPPAPGQRA
jgi:hypothetical protein